MALIKSFHGVVPRLPAIDLQYNYAEVAENVDLRGTTLRPWQAPKKIKDTTAKTVYPFGCCWFEWDKCVEVAEWTVDCPRLYVTGDKDYPYVAPLNETDCSFTNILRLGVPAPKTAPHVKAILATQPNNETIYSNSEQRESRSYVYTYINKLGEEGPPSYPSEPVDTDDGNPVTLTGFSIPDDVYGVESICIYRSVTGFRNETQVQVGPVPMLTDYFRVATIPVSQATHIDSGLNTDTLGDVLSTMDTLEPPKGLRGITQIPNTRMLAGFEGNLLCFSVNGQPWNWPIAFRYQLDDEIRAIAVLRDKLYVLTDGYPYTVALNAGTNLRQPHAIMRHASSMPMVGCSQRSVISTPVGVFYVGEKGLVSMAGEPTLMTATWISPHEWRQLQPENMCLGWYEGTVFMSSQAQTYLLQLDDNAYGNGEYNRLTTSTIRADYFLSNRQGQLFFNENGVLYQWGAGDQVMTYRWKSSETNSKGGGYFGALRIWGAGSVTANFYAEKVKVISDLTLTPLIKYRLPHYGHHLHHQIEFVGTNELEQAELAQTFRDLSMY